MPSMGYRARIGTVDDVDAIHRIWLAGVENSLGAPLARDAGVNYRGYFRTRLESRSEIFKFFVVENSRSEVVSWQSLSPLRSHPSVATTMAELSAYTSPRQPPGRSTLLGLETLLSFADETPLHYVVAFITDTNVGAQRLALHLGMLHTGSFPSAPRSPHLPPLHCFVYPCQAGRTHC